MALNVLFDLHDTLVRVERDDMAKRRMAAYRVLAGLPEAPSFEAFAARDEEVRQSNRSGEPLRDRGVDNRFERALAGLISGEPPDGLVERMVDAYVDCWIGGLSLFPSTVETLHSLWPHYRLAIVSDFGHGPGVWRILSRFGLLGFFEPIVVSAEVGYTKPHAAMFQRALDDLGASPSDCVFVGDNPVCDVEGPRRMGIRAILLDVDGRHPDHAGERIRDLSELPEILAGRQADRAVPDSRLQPE